MAAASSCPRLAIAAPGGSLAARALPAPSGFARLPGLAFVPPRRLRRRPGFLRTPRSAAPLRVARVARPLRRAAPASRASFAAPPAPPLALVRAFALRRVSLPPSAFAPALASLRASWRSPLLCSCLALVQRVGLRGASLVPFGLRPRSLPPRPPARRWRACPPFGGRGVGFCSPAPARAALPLPLLLGSSRASPPSPPRPCAPAGGFGERLAFGRDSAPLGRASRAPFTRSPRPLARPRRGRFAAVDIPEIVNRESRCGACASPPLSHCPAAVKPARRLALARCALPGLRA